MENFNAFRCSYPTGQAISFDGRKAITEPDSFRNPLTIASVNWRDRTAQLVGDIGTSPLTIFIGADIISFLLITDNGGMIIYALHRSIGAETFPSSQVRSVGFPGQVRPSVFVGTCLGLR